MRTATRSFETRLLVVLLVLVSFFTFWVIPVGVKDPEGFGYAQGLPPSFSVYLVAILTAIILFGRLLRLLIAGPATEDGHGADASRGSGQHHDDTSDDADAEPAGGRSDSNTRSWAIIGACLIFAYVLIPYAGFYVSSFVFVIFLGTVMGERRPMVLTLLPVLLVAGIYTAFELGFAISLPRGELVLRLFSSFAS